MSRWDHRFLEMARHVAGFSKDPSTKVGAVLVRPDHTIAGMGFNGFPRGLADRPERLHDREWKLAHTIHAELNAVLSTGDVRGMSIYITHPPCNACTICLVQAGIVRVLWQRADADFADRWGATRQRSISILSECKVEWSEA